MLAHARGARQREPADLNALVAGAVDLAYQGLRNQDPSFHITIENSYDPGLPLVQAVAGDLSRAFLNIANNGCYAAYQKSLQLGTGFQPTLKVSTRTIGAQVEIRIADNGTGISKETLLKIFNPFFTTKPPGSGMGLGLSLSYQIVVEQHKGTIRVETTEGESTTLIVLLPKAAK
jgi:signal transduction histidine kinase